MNKDIIQEVASRVINQESVINATNTSTVTGLTLLKTASILASVPSFQPVAAVLAVVGIIATFYK